MDEKLIRELTGAVGALLFVTRLLGRFFSERHSDCTEIKARLKDVEAELFGNHPDSIKRRLEALERYR